MADEYHKYDPAVAVLAVPPGAAAPDSSSKPPSSQLENSPVLPMCASKWNRSDAEQLNIFYQKKHFSEILTDIAEFDSGRNKGFLESRLVKTYCGLMDFVFGFEREQSRRLTKILTSPIKSRSDLDNNVYGDNALRFLKDLHNEVKDNNLYMYLHAEEIEAQLGMVQLRGFIPRVIDFLQEFRMMLCETAEGRPPTESTFESLFMSFGQIFAIPFRHGKVRQMRLMDIFGQTVKCEPDLRYECIEGPNVFVVPVTEVKKFAREKLKENDVNTDRKLRSSLDGQGCSEDGQSCSEDVPSSSPKRMKMAEDVPSSSPKRMKMDDESHYVDLPNDICGQHAAELLLELQHSPWEVSGNRKCMLGLIVQATKVRLTCLDMSNEHFNQLKEETFRPLVNKDAVIHFTEAYDMFVKEDRKKLVSIMMALGSMGRKNSPVDMLPSSLLEHYLKK